MANKLFSFEEFNKSFWEFYRNKQLEIINEMENDSIHVSDDIDESINNGSLRRRLREI